MKRFWVKNGVYENQLIIFKYSCKGNEKTIRLSAAPFYSIYVDGEFFSYGPERTGKGYSRVSEIELPKGINEIEIKVISPNCPTFDCDYFHPFFGAQFITSDNNVIEPKWEAYEDKGYLKESCRYSFQRGFVERFDLRKDNYTRLDLEEYTENIIELPSNELNCSYRRIEFKQIDEFVMNGFDEYIEPYYLYKNPIFAKSLLFDPVKDFIEKIKVGYSCKEYTLGKVKTGLFNIEILSPENGVECFLVFDEFKPDGKWIFGRSSCTDMMQIILKKGVNKLINLNPYCLQYLRVISSQNIECKCEFILVENESIKRIEKTGDEELDRIFEAAKNTYVQNAFDLFTDCPGRERAGWLCDSFFTGMTEHNFTGQNKIEKHFLENIINSNQDILDPLIVPMCYPSYHQDKTFIPNWAMWFILEIEQYHLRNRDELLKNNAKDRVFGILKFLARYENEYGLLENLPSWVFVEWSKCNDYVNGINIPSNMLYVATLESAYRMYGETEFLNKAEKLRKEINSFAFDGNYYHDQILRLENSQLKINENAISETCQYYALFFDFCPSQSYKDEMLNNFGPFRKKDYHPEISPSAVFIGYFLRLICLAREKMTNQLVKEIKSYFSYMADSTDTLWEKATANASCNHGFASSVIPIYWMSK
ncbi:MAG: hypothetical protein IJ247_03555 [Bacilli bacterium]|nr:hypothetical protein [Bacilli bacterium]